MLQDRAAVEEHHERFLKRVVAGGAVWALRNAAGYLTCESNEEPEDAEVPRSIFLFWSDAAYARRVAQAEQSDHDAVSIPLADFLERWLPGIADDGLLVGTNYDAQLFGIELAPIELLEQLRARLLVASPDQ